MTENPPEVTTPTEPIEALPEVPTTREAVYDLAELRFVDGQPGETAKQTVARLNKGNEVGRADGKQGNRYTLRKV